VLTRNTLEQYTNLASIRIDERAQCRKDTHTQKGPRHWCVKFENDFEPWLTRWWSRQDYVTAYSEGLFTHDRLDRARVPVSSTYTG